MHVDAFQLTTESIKTFVCACSRHHGLETNIIVISILNR